jgi:hypothetical protein
MLHFSFNKRTSIFCHNGVHAKPPFRSDGASVVLIAVIGVSLVSEIREIEEKSSEVVKLTV